VMTRAMTPRTTTESPSGRGINREGKSKLKITWPSCLSRR
jgi:hypothetical protein